MLLGIWEGGGGVAFVELERETRRLLVSEEVH